MTHSVAYRRMLNKMGYYNYQNGLIYRHLNQEGGWDSHLERCRNFIIRALDLYKPDKVTVLGSGWLLELPLAEMIEKNLRVCLVDIVHPPEVISQTGNLQNVELVEADVTGGLIEEVWEKSGKYSIFNRLQSIEKINIPEYIPETDPGLVISLNILSQLESLPVSFLRRRSNFREEDLFWFRSEIQKKHIGFLKKYNSVLVTDSAEVFTDNSGNVTEEITVVTDLPEGKIKEEWDWNFDLTGSDYYTRRSILKVAALIL
jgi:hypothetical protein